MGVVEKLVRKPWKALSDEDFQSLSRVGFITPTLKMGGKELKVGAPC